MDYFSEIKGEFRKFKIRRAFKESIEPEEVLMDAQKNSEFQNQKLETPLKKKIFSIFFGFILLSLLVLICFAGYSQLFKGNDYLVLANQNSQRAYPIAPPRGLIYDRNLKILVSNIETFDVFLLPLDLPEKALELNNAINRISEVLDLSSQEIKQKLLDFDSQKEQRILLASNLTPEKISALQEEKDLFPVLSIEPVAERQYIFGEAISHILGYTGWLNQDDVNFSSASSLLQRSGKAGLEAQYEDYLKGEKGERMIEVDSLGRKIRELGVKDPLPGKNIITTIDKDLQLKIFEALKNQIVKIKAKRAVAVAMDPTNGQILAMVSLPSYNNNLFENGASADELNKILNDPDKPMFNRVISGQYPSGSTIKPLLGSAALQEGIVTPATTILDTGNIRIINQYNQQVVYDFPDWKAHGVVNIYSAIAQSCDVYFYTIGGGYGNIPGLGIDRIKKYLNLFGLGQKMGIDLPQEANGLVPDSDWKRKVKNEAWFIGDTYHVSIGQGDLLATPLQVAVAISAIANDGRLFTPYLVDKIIDSDKNNIKVFEPRIIREGFISSKNLAVIRKGMREAVTSGSAAFLKDLPVPVAGKTGTVQLAGQEKNNAWFVGFAPYDNPKIVLAIMIENVGEGSSYAVPVAKEILNWYFSSSIK